MATSGYRDEYVTKWDTLRFSWSRTSYSIENNTSTISWSLQLIATSYGAINSAPAKAWNVNVSGVTYSGTMSVNIGNNTTKTLASGSTTIYHNADGTRTFSYSFSQTFNITFSGNYIGTVSGSSSGTLDTIPRYATITSAPDSFNDETTNLAISFNNPGNFDLQLKIEAGGDSSLIVRDKVTKTSPYTFVLTEAEKNKLRQKCTSNTLLVRFTVATYINGTVTNWSYVDKTMNLVNCTPTLNPTVVDVGTVSTTLTGDPNKLIMHYNIARVAFNATALKEGSISSMKVTCGNASRFSDGDMGYIESGTFVFSVTDNRGNTASKTITKTIIDYVPLTCNLNVDSDLIDGATANMKLNVFGNYFNGSFGAVTNSLSIKYRYKLNDGSYPTDDDGNYVWTTVSATPTKSNGKYSVQEVLTGLSYQNTYTFQVKVEDAVYHDSGAKTSEQVVKIVPTFDWSENDFNFNVPVHGAGGFTYNIPIMQKADCNSFTTSGVWYLVDPAAHSRPVGIQNGWLQSFVYEGVGPTDTGAKKFIYQRYIPAQSISSASICERVMIGGTWSNWEFETLRCYPINSIYISYSHTSPASLFGGTWTRMQNTFLWGCDPDGAIGATGGESTHVLGSNEMPWHRHTGLYYTVNSQAVSMNRGSGGYALTWSASVGNGAADIYTGAAGNTEAHNNMPPFTQVSIWRRTA